MGYFSNNRYAPKFTNIHEYLRLFDNVAEEGRKPFLIVIDGINEVNALEEFNDELKDFCNAVCQYDHVKIVITCRSEFFDEKYASLLYEPFGPSVHRVTDLRSQMSDLSKRRLLRSYLAYFKVECRLSKVAEDFLTEDMLLLRIFCERHEGQDVGYLSDIYKGDLFEDFLRKKIEAFPDNLRDKAFSILLKIVSSMLSADDFSRLSVRGYDADEKAIIQRFMADDVILRQEIAQANLFALGDLIISFTYDELRDFIVAYKLIEPVDGENAELLRDALLHLKGRTIFEGVFRYIYLLARKMNKTAAIAACERTEHFVEHFSLNVNLLPPSIQNEGDVTRLREILTDISLPQRARRITMFLCRRRDPGELLNITILIDHLNELQDEEHKAFIRTIFANPNAFSSRDWRQRIDELVESVCDENAGETQRRCTAEWLAFFLHASSLASWYERERVAAMFKDAGNGPEFLCALDLVRSAKSQALQYLLSDIAMSAERE